MSGSDSRHQENVYGTKGVAAPANVPGGRWGGQTWTDDSGNLWLFGGAEADADPPVAGRISGAEATSEVAAGAT